MAKATSGIAAALSGRIGELVFCRRGDGVYVRQWVRPEDPKSEQQLRQRGRFAAAAAAWRALPAEQQARYTERARRMGRRGYNLFLTEQLRPAADDPAGDPLTHEPIPTPASPDTSRTPPRASSMSSS